MSIYFGSTPVGTRIYEPPTPPTPTYTSAQYFKFSGSTLTKYVGSDSNIVLPISYSTTSEQRQFDGVVVPTSAFSSAGIWGMYNYSITLAPTSDSSNTTVYNTMTDSDNLQQVYGDYVLLISATNNDGNDLGGIYNVLSNGAGFPMLINNTVCKDTEDLNQIDWGNLQSVSFAGTGTITSFIDGNTYTVTEIGSNAFINTGVQSIVISEGYTTIAGEAFTNLAITSLNIPASVTSIGSGITNHCTNLTALTVNANNSYFDSRDNCNAIIRKADNCLVAGCVSTTMPSSVQRIGSHAFNGIPITSTMLNDNIVEIGDGAYQGTAITSVYFPANVTQLNWGVFADCYSLSLTTIPNQITSISDSAFANVNFSNGLTIEGQVSYIGYVAFSNLNTNTITVNATTPPSITESTFGGYSGQLTVYVPTGTVSAYQSASYWQNYNITDGSPTQQYYATVYTDDGQSQSSHQVELSSINYQLDFSMDSTVYGVDIGMTAQEFSQAGGTLIGYENKIIARQYNSGNITYVFTVSDGHFTISQSVFNNGSGTALLYLTNAGVTSNRGQATIVNQGSYYDIEILPRSGFTDFTSIQAQVTDDIRDITSYQLNMPSQAEELIGYYDNMGTIETHTLDLSTVNYQVPASIDNIPLNNFEYLVMSSNVTNIYWSASVLDGLSEIYYDGTDAQAQNNLNISIDNGSMFGYGLLSQKDSLGASTHLVVKDNNTGYQLETYNVYPENQGFGKWIDNNGTIVNSGNCQVYRSNPNVVFELNGDYIEITYTENAGVFTHYVQIVPQPPTSAEYFDFAQDGVITRYKGNFTSIVTPTSYNKIAQTQQFNGVKFYTNDLPNNFSNTGLTFTLSYNEDGSNPQTYTSDDLSGVTLDTYAYLLQVDATQGDYTNIKMIVNLNPDNYPVCVNSNVMNGWNEWNNYWNSGQTFNTAQVFNGTGTVYTYEDGNNIAVTSIDTNFMREGGGGFVSDYYCTTLTVSEGVTSMLSPEGLQNLQTLNLPSTLTNIANPIHNQYLSTVSVATGNTYFEVVSDVLYQIYDSQPVKYILWCSRQKQGSFTVASDVSFVNSFAFEYSQLSSVTFDNGFAGGMGEHVFQQSSISSIVFTDLSTTIDVTEYTFYGASNITSLILPPINATSLLIDCRNLQTLDLSRTSITDLNLQFIYGSMSNCSYPNTLTTLGIVYIDASSSFTIPSTVTTIKHFNTSNESTNPITSYTFADTITDFGIQSVSSTFDGGGTSPITTFEFGNNVSTMYGDYFFSNCPNLTSITINTLTPPTVDSGFWNDSSITTVYVPASAVSDYQNDAVWGQKSIVAIQ